MTAKSLSILVCLLLVVITASSLYAQRGSLFRLVTPLTELTPEELALPLKESEVTVNTQYVTTQTSLDVILSNPHNQTLYFGRQYDFYKLEDGEWKPFPNYPAWYYNTISIGHGGVLKQTNDIKGFTSGRYKVVKTLEYHLANGTIPKFQAEAEFIVDRPAADPEGAPNFGYNLIHRGLNSGSATSFASMDLYNNGGLTLTLTSEYRLYDYINGQWVEVSRADAGGPNTILAPGEAYTETFYIKPFPRDSFRYVKPVYVEGYKMPAQFVVERVQDLS